jgi:hypothetical protein
MSNTTIQILRSYTTNTPSSNSLSDGELAYSFSSNTLFIGDQYGDVIAIGGPNVQITLVDGGSF